MAPTLYEQDKLATSVGRQSAEAKQQQQALVTKKQLTLTFVSGKPAWFVLLTPSQDWQGVLVASHSSLADLLVFRLRTRLMIEPLKTIERLNLGQRREFEGIGVV